MCGRAGCPPSHKTCSPTSLPWGCCCGFPCTAGSVRPPSAQALTLLSLTAPISSPCSHLSVLVIVRESKRQLTALGMFTWQLQHPHSQDSLWEVRGCSPNSSGSAALGCERRPCSPSSMGGKHGVSSHFSRAAWTPGLLCGVSLCRFSMQQHTEELHATFWWGQWAWNVLCQGCGTNPPLDEDLRDTRNQVWKPSEIV